MCQFLWSFFVVLSDENADGRLLTTYCPLMIKIRCYFGTKRNNSQRPLGSNIHPETECQQQADTKQILFYFGVCTVQLNMSLDI